MISVHKGETSSTYCWWGKLITQQVNEPADDLLKSSLCALFFNFYSHMATNSV